MFSEYKAPFWENEKVLLELMAMVVEHGELLDAIIHLKAVKMAALL